MDWAKTTARRDKKHLYLGIGVSYIRELTVIISTDLLHGWVYSSFFLVMLLICVQSFCQNNKPQDLVPGGSQPPFVLVKINLGESFFLRV